MVVVTQKIVSKAEGRMVQIDPDDPGAKEALVASESVRVLRRRGDLVISETRQGFVCANAGVDLSNVPQGTAALLPVDADRSARRLRDRLISLTGVKVAVIISDTFGRPWRRGVVDVAIGCDGVAAVLDLRGSLDANGRELVATELCIADEIASAAELVMGKDRGVPVAVVRGTDPAWARRSSVAARDHSSPVGGPVPLTTTGFRAASRLSRLAPKCPSVALRSPFQERSERTPTEVDGGLRGVQRRAADLTRALGCVHRGNVTPAQIRHHVVQLVDAHLGARPDVEGQSPSAFRRAYEGVDHVVDVDESRGSAPRLPKMVSRFVPRASSPRIWPRHPLPREDPASVRRCSRAPVRRIRMSGAP